VTERRRSTRAALLGAVVIAVLALAAIVIAPDFARRAPDYVEGVARDLWSIVGVRRVERHAAEIRAAAAESGIDPCLLAAVMYAESKGQVDAVSAATRPASSGCRSRRARSSSPMRSSERGSPPRTSPG
jgi:hypothetical protein